MDKENLSYFRNGIFITYKNNAFRKFADKWMELEKSYLSEVILTHEKYGACL